MEEFEKWLKETAEAYAMEIVEDPENHIDAVEAIACDFEEGARAAYEKFCKHE